MEDREEFYNLKKLAMGLALISVAVAINHLVIPAMIISGITIVLGGYLFYREGKSPVKGNSNLALWSTLLGMAMFLSVFFMDILHL